MLTDQIFRDLLSKYQVNSDLWDFFKKTLRQPIEDAINEHFDERPNYRYGGSLAKGTANSNSCDVDLLVYFDEDYDKSVADIYAEVAMALSDAGYLIEKKNSAINVYGRYMRIWEYVSVDVVPGKYSVGGDEKDVYLYCNKDRSRLKSNPEKQIDKIKESKMKQVIRLIKLLRTTYGFSFKSFFLELFAVDIVEPNLDSDASLTEKIIQFAKSFSEIGISKVYDPANPNGNNIMDIHTDYEFQTIRQYIKNLYEVLLTDDENLVIDYLTNEKQGNGLEEKIKESYKNSANGHSLPLKLTVGYSSLPALSLVCRLKGTSTELPSGQVVKKDTYLRFEINKSSYYSGYTFRFIVSNAGYEARVANQLRGKAEEPDKDLSTSTKYIREEHTSFNGNHYVQVIATHPSKNNLYSMPFIVKVRDFN